MAIPYSLMNKAFHPAILLLFSPANGEFFPRIPHQFEALPFGNDSFFRLLEVPLSPLPIFQMNAPVAVSLLGY